MGISTKKGDSGYTSLLRGERVPKYHPITETLGALDEANSFLGLARASSKEKRTKRIILQIQKHLFIMGGELSVPKGKGKPPKNIVSETEVKWLEKFIEELEEALSLPPGFVAFGQQEGSSHLDVARTSIRKTERLVVKLKSDNMIENRYILKYLNRLSDLLFVLACLEEKDEKDRQKISRTLFYFQLSDPMFRKWTFVIGALIMALILTVLLLFFFHGNTPKVPTSQTNGHMKQMETMHPQIDE